MAIFNTIEELKTAINDTIYANDAGLITAEDLQERMHDIIDTLNAISTSVAGVKAYLESVNNLSQIYIGSVKASIEGHTHSELVAVTQKGAVNGVAELDASGKVPVAQLPSYVDDVIDAYIIGDAFAANWLSLTVGGAALTPDSNKIYIVITAGEYQYKTYRWSGSVYAEISPSLILGESSGSAYRGDRGKIAYDHSQASGNPHNTTATQVGAEPANANIQSHISNNNQAHSDYLKNNADDSTSGTLTAAGFKVGDFEITVVAGELVVKYATTVIFKWISTGYVYAKDDIEPKSL